MVPKPKLNLGRPLERGDLRLLMLGMLKKPMHGYQIMRRFKEYSKGDYMPSTGALYPQLRSLEEEGLIRCDENNGKKTYAVTKEGEEYLKRNEKMVRQTMKRFTEFWSENDLGILVGRMESISKTLMNGAASALESGNGQDLKKIERSKSLLAKTEEELRDIWA